MRAGIRAGEVEWRLVHRVWFESTVIVIDCFRGELIGAIPFITAFGAQRVVAPDGSAVALFFDNAARTTSDTAVVITLIHPNSLADVFWFVGLAAFL